MANASTPPPQLNARSTQFLETEFYCEGIMLKNQLKRIEISIQYSKGEELLGILCYLAFWKNM